MTKLLEKHGKSVLLTVKLILHWVESHDKGLNASTAFAAELWDGVGVKLWDSGIKGDKLLAVF